MIERTEFFEVLVQRGSDAVISIDEESTILFANESVGRVFGHPPEALVGEPLTKVMPERFTEKHHGAVQNYLETGERGLDWTNIRLPGQHADGHEVPLSITFEEHTFDGERVFSGIIRDVSEQRAYEETLETLQETARELLQARQGEEIATVTVRATAEVLDLPLATVYLHESTNDRLQPVAYTDEVAAAIGDPPPALDSDDGPLWQAFERGTSHRYDDFAAETGAKGDVVHERMLLVPLGAHGILVVGGREGEGIDDEAADLTHLLAANAEAALNRTAREGELERQNERLERFAGIVSHDLRDPLNTLRAQVTLARADPDGDHLDEMEAVIDRMESLVEDVLTLTKEGKAVGEAQTVSLDRVVEDAWTTAGDESSTLVADTLGSVEADPERLRTLFENLLGNAVTHGGEEVAVEVGRLDRGGFYVADDGPGIPPDERESVLDYGFTTSEQGTGFGLNIVKNIAEAHGWSVTVGESESGGARFEFAVDRTPARVDEQ